MKPNTDSKTIKISEIIGAEIGVITLISIQKKNSTRYSIHVNDKFLIGISDSCLVHFSISKGMQVNQAFLNTIIEYEEKWAIREYCLRLLGRRDHASGELVLKAKRKGYSGSSIDEVIEELELKGYLNNQTFAEKFSRDKFKFNKWGPNKIRAELLKKGLNNRLIDNALSQLSEDDTIQIIQNLIQKNRMKFQRVEKFNRKKKIFDFLIRKGFPISIVSSIIDTIMDEFEDQSFDK